MKRLHLCFLCNEYPPGKVGGIGTFTQTLGRKLAERGHQVTVVGFYKFSQSSEEHDAGVCVRRLPHTRLPWAGFWMNGVRLRRELQAIHKRNPIDLLEGPESAFALIARNLPGKSLIRMHGGHHFFFKTLGDQPLLWRSWLERRSFARVDNLCAVSRFVAEETRTLLGLGRVTIEILPNPVDTTRFQPMPEIQTEPCLIAFVGTLCEKKGVRQLVQAMPEILAAAPQARLMVYGRDSIDRRTGGPYREGLQKAVEASVRKRISFFDHVENHELPGKLAPAEVLAYPSHMEAQGIVIIEGMAMGKPVVTSRTGPGPELVEDGSSGLLCDPHDPHSIAQAIIRVLKDRNLADRLGAAARHRALAEFSADVMVPKNEDFYRRCLEANVHE